MPTAAAAIERGAIPYIGEVKYPASADSFDQQRAQDEAQWVVEVAASVSKCEIILPNIRLHCLCSGRDIMQRRRNISALNYNSIPLKLELGTIKPNFGQKG